MLNNTTIESPKLSPHSLAVERSADISLDPLFEGTEEGEYKYTVTTEETQKWLDDEAFIETLQDEKPNVSTVQQKVPKNVPESIMRLQGLGTKSENGIYRYK